VARLEAEAFSTPWSADTFRRLLRSGGPALLVAELPELPVAGYAVLWCFGDQGELANIAVAPGCRGRGIGSRLLTAVLDMARDRGVEELFLEVRESNERAIDMYERRGFELLGRRVGYYDRPREDARVMRVRLKGAIQGES
jgi:ribosomal-protein-alanine N-acetyltransferase